jgi:hypothetical protein
MVVFQLINLAKTLWIIIVEKGFFVGNTLDRDLINLYPINCTQLVAVLVSQGIFNIVDCCA